VPFAFLQALILAIIAWTAWQGRGTGPLLFLIEVVVFAACGAMTTPAWGSLFSEFVEPARRGVYFGWRIRFLGFVTVGGAFAAGIVLQAVKKGGPLFGFAILFCAAALARLLSSGFLAQMTEPAWVVSQEARFSLWDFLVRVRESNFAKFVLFVSLMNFSVNLASPFFPVLMLRELGFSYLLYSAITVTATLTVYLTVSRWGAHADCIGNLGVMRLTAPLIGVIPLLWILNRHPAFLFAAQVFSGFAWAGFNLCAGNFIYDAVVPEKRTRCIAYFNVLNGSALCAGALLGGFLLAHLPLLQGSVILTLFLVSAVLRLLVGLWVPRLLHEVRPVAAMRLDELFFSMVGIRPCPLVSAERKTIRIP